MTLLEHIKHGTLMLAVLDELYLCPELSCRVVSNCSTDCPVCGSQVLALATLLKPKEDVLLDSGTD